ncbi:phytoene desaturase family protein [Streptomyces physcomitrii]|uniref:NAD(P)/FAD-dependent oxidoreductase n=1 Tax=Streptomyces physcomitrii TaxID=2724184 RepID=A0ABX1GZA7_9ACTN|nr:NAD(P)/FAD-dependent oxidoreductase [Streptomyces physcomitrii]NKI41421.1 NAD(P)/FAD-dependent oxidoreductase [Streptomyces physcomitrii]
MARIAVIGAGMGAMAAAARLAVAGHDVVVYERGATHGGALGRSTRDGFAFDTGPVLLTLPAVYRDLFVKTGRKSLEDRLGLTQVEPAVRHLFADGTRVDLPNASRAGVGQALDAALGAGSGERWAAFVNRAREAWDRSRRPLLEEPLWPNWQVLAEREPYPAVPRRRLLRRELRATTLAEIAALELGDEPRLRALLEQYALAAGLDPRTAPASAAVLPYMEQTFGLWSVEGGMRALADALYERCRERRVRFRFGTPVRRVVIRGGRAVGVAVDTGVRDAGAEGTGAAQAEAGGGPATTVAEEAAHVVEEADHVVAGVAPDVLDSLLDGVPAREETGVPARRTARSRVTLLLALRGARTPEAACRTVVHTPDREGELAALFGAEPGLPERPTVTVHRLPDPSLVPDPDHEAVTVTATVPAATGEAAEAADDAVSAPSPGPLTSFADRMTAAARREIPDLDGRLLWREVRTPREIEAATGTPGVPAPALAAGGGRWLHPANSTAVEGLFTVGGWSHPGGGLAHAGMSGALVAGLIVEGPDFRGSQ